MGDDLDLDGLLDDLENLEMSTPRAASKRNSPRQPGSNNSQNIVNVNENVSNSKLLSDTEANTLDELLKMTDPDSPVNSPVCPLKTCRGRVLKVNTTHVQPDMSNIDSILSSANEAFGDGDNMSLSESTSSISPRPPPPKQSRSNSNRSTPIPASPPATTDSTKPPVSPVPSSAELSQLEQTVNDNSTCNKEIVGTIDVGDFDADSESTSNAGKSPSNPFAARNTAAAGSIGSIVSNNSSFVSRKSSVSALAQEEGELDIDTLSSDVNAVLGIPEAKVIESDATGMKTSKIFRALPLEQTSATGEKKKCIRVIVGGASSKRGQKLSSFSKDTVCSNIRCIKCNFSVRTYKDCAWAPSVDYIFLRTNVPNDERVSEQLVEKKGSCSYCCQCSWIEAAEERDVKKEPALQWACSGH